MPHLRVRQVTTALPPPGVTGGPVATAERDGAATLLASTDVIGVERQRT